MGACGSKPTKSVVVEANPVRDALATSAAPSAAPAEVGAVETVEPSLSPGVAEEEAAVKEQASEIKPPLLPGEQSFELAVPDGCEHGSRLLITLAGIDHQVMITVPEGATAGRSISFTMKGLPDAKQAQAAVTIQALHRGNIARDVLLTYHPSGHAAPPFEPSSEAEAPAAAADSARTTHDPALYPSLASTDDAADDVHDAAAPPRAEESAATAVYRPRGHSAPPLAEAAAGEDEAWPHASPHDPLLYPSLASAQLSEEPATVPVAAAQAVYKPRGYAAPPSGEDDAPTAAEGAASTPDPALYPSLALPVTIDEGEEAEEEAAVGEEEHKGQAMATEKTAAASPAAAGGEQAAGGGAPLGGVFDAIGGALSRMASSTTNLLERLE